MFSLKKILTKILSDLESYNESLSDLLARGPYSTTETYIGTYNGDPLYRRIYTSVTLSPQSSWTYSSAMPLPSYKNIIYIGGVMLESNSPGHSKPVPYHETDNHHVEFLFNPEQSNLGYRFSTTSATLTFDIILEYTKEA